GWTPLRLAMGFKKMADFLVVVDAKDEEAGSFYERYGFIKFPERPHRLFLPMKTIARLFG
ncbi:MAG: GNAT family N-acetyltransferase, partial [Candidatus Latescibacteria bacterium]|nr:GNAT family N-acetyltransferase [Candidatus Latescibacterota bacterium]